MAIEWPRPQPRIGMGVLPAITTNGNMIESHHNDAAGPEENAWRWIWNNSTMEVSAKTATTMNQCIAPHPTATQGIIPLCLNQVTDGKGVRVLNTPSSKRRFEYHFPPPLFGAKAVYCVKCPVSSLKDVQSSKCYVWTGHLIFPAGLFMHSVPFWRESDILREMPSI